MPESLVKLGAVLPVPTYSQSKSIYVNRVKDRNELGEAFTSRACSQDEENVRLQGVRSDLVVPRPLGAKQIRILVHSM